MGKLSKGISLPIIITAFLLNVSFVLLWINEAGLSSYKYLSEPSLWGWVCFVSILLSFPSSVFKYGKIISIILLYLYSIFLIANLMYCDAFNTQISLNAYSMWTNLYSFKDSVSDVFHVRFLILSIIVTVGGIVSVIGTERKILYPRWIILLASFLWLIISFNIPNSFVYAFAKLRITHHENSAITILYSPFTNLLFQYLAVSNPDLNCSEKEVVNIINKNMHELQDRSNGRKHNALVLIVVESLESFVIDLEVEGIPIAPNLSDLAHRDKTLFVPMIVPEVGIARSMDAQLIINCGLLPPTDEAFCFTYPSNSYPGIAWQMSARYPNIVSYSITSDFASTYNQAVVSKAFGYGNLITRERFLTDPPSSIHVDDSVFFAQTRILLEENIWPAHKPAIIQLVTYSMHQPFRLPLSTVKTVFGETNPKLQKYLNVVRYTDKAIGDFIRYLETRDDFSSVLVVITGDHNVFSKAKYESLGITKVSSYESPYLPLIILNSSERGEISNPRRQTSIYPTLLELLGITQNVWPGMGKSVFNADTTLSDDMQSISNYLIRNDYWKVK